MAKKVKIIIENRTDAKVEAKPEGLQPDVAVQRWNKEETFLRECSFDAQGISKDARSCSMSISSELPVSRGDYDEVLSHASADCDMTRIASGSHPLLLDHDTSKQIGVVESARIDGDKKIRATVRFSKSQLGDEIWQDVQDGIRRLVSVGYRRTREIASETVNGREVVRFAWQPYEASIVAIPADAGVGIGRNEDLPAPAPEPEKPVPSVPTERIEIMSEKVETVDPLVAERKRVSDIQTIQKRLSDKIPGCADVCGKAIAEGTAVSEVQDKLFLMMPGVTPATPARIEISEKDSRRYSLAGAILRRSEGKQIEGIEKELSDEVAKQIGRSPEGFWVPHTLLGTRADNTVGTATMGGNLVATNLLAGSFIDILRNRAWVAQLGARMLDGLIGNVVIPRQLAAATAYWEGEIIATTQSNTGFDQLTLTPKAVTGFEVYSKMLLMQSTPSVDNLIRDDLLKVLALAIDKAALTTADAQGPTGIPGTTGITTVTASTAGIIPTFASIVSLESAVALGNADVGNLAYLTNPAVRGALKTAVKSTYSGAYGFIWESDGTMNGYRSEVTNQLVRTNTVGTLTTECSSIFFGNWQDLVIGTWGGTDIVIDPYTNAATREIRIFASNWCDLGVRHAKSFAWMPDALSA
jgi:HK97 family phage major capsid protein